MAESGEKCREEIGDKFKRKLLIRCRDRAMPYLSQEYQFLGVDFRDMAI